MQIIHSTITLILIFTTLYSYGLFVSNKIYKTKNLDIFFKILIGYVFVGSLTVIFHFFFSINSFFSIFLIIFSLIILFFHFSKIDKKDFLTLVFIISLLGYISFGYSDHPIDANMYHHPYVSYLNSEKIIFSIANIQFRFGHISFLQYVQSALTNDYLHKISLASINIIFYICFIFFIFQKIIKTKNLSYNFLINILFASFLLIKFARYREYGNDLIPLLVCIYFLIQILETNKQHPFSNKNLINLSLPFVAFMFAHKISYVFAFLIFLPLYNFSKLKFLKEINIAYLVAFFLIVIPWLIKNYITTSCFAYPVEISCFSNSLYALKGIAEPSNASWLTEIWAKGFIDHPNWKSLDLGIYANGFNWVPTWFGGHFIKILEIVAPLLFIIFLFVIYLLIKKKYYLEKTKVNTNARNYFYFWFAIFLGLSIWFYKAPVFRYGSFYIISFIIMSYILFFSYFYKLKKSTNLKFFKVIFLISLSFFVVKNTKRIYESNLTLFPKNNNLKNIQKISVINDDKLKLYTVKTDLCYYTKLICSHETTEGITIKKLGNYYLLVRQP